MRHAILAALALCLATAARADDSWTLTTADFHRTLGTLKGIDAAAVHVLPASGGADVTIPIDTLLRADRAARPSPSQPKFTLYLQNGDRLTGEPGAMKDDVLTWTSPAIGPLQLPVQKLRGFSRLPAVGGIDDERKEDQVALSNRDVVRGAVVGIEEAKILIQTGGDTVPLPLSSADSILFASSGKQPAPADRSWRVRLVDGSALTVPALTVADGKLTFDLPLAKNAAAHSTDLANVVSIEQLNGPVSWLSDRTPKVNEQVPFNAETTYPARMDQNVFGKPLRVGAQTFDKGIGVHANSRLVFPLGGQYKLFRTRYAVDTTGEAGSANVNIRILLDGRVVHEQKEFKAFQISPVVTVELGDARELTLEVTAAGITDTQDRLDWIEPALVRSGTSTTAPATAPSTTTGPSTKP